MKNRNIKFLSVLQNKIDGNPENYTFWKIQILRCFIKFGLPPSWYLRRDSSVRPIKQISQDLYIFLPCKTEITTIAVIKRQGNSEAWFIWKVLCCSNSSTASLVAWGLLQDNSRSVECVITPTVKGWKLAEITGLAYPKCCLHQMKYKEVNKR